MGTAGYTMEKGKIKEELVKLLKDTFYDMDHGRHCWAKVKPGLWLTAEPFAEDGVTYLEVYLSSGVDSLGYTYGDYVDFMGSVTGIQEIEGIVEFALEAAKKYADGNPEDDTGNSTITLNEAWELGSRDEAKGDRAGVR